MSTYGLGSLRKIKTGTWELTFYHDNKRRYVTVHAKTRREAWSLAHTKRQSLITDLIEGSRRKQERQLGDLWIDYIDYASPNLTTITVKGYNASWHTAFKSLHKIPARKLTPQHLKDAMHEYKTSPIRRGKKINKYPSNRSQQRSYTMLGTFFRWCVYEDYLDVNPLDKVRRPRISEAERMPPATFTADEFNRYLEACGRWDAIAERNPWYALMCYVARATGMRLGEVLGLTFRSIDFDNYRVRVTQAVGVEQELKAPKAHSIRYITVNKDFIDQISEQLIKVDALQQQNKKYWQDNNLVFPDPVGRPLKTNTVSQRFRKIKNSIGLRKELKHKNLRHTFATDLISNGFDIKTVQEMMGHRLSSTTEQYYQGLSTRSQAEVADFVQKNILPLSEQERLKDILN
jgi:integrase